MASNSRPATTGSRPLSPTAKSDRRVSQQRSPGHATASPADDDASVIMVDDQLIDLRSRPLAAFLAWLVPGLGHAYQGRYTKAATFAVCILSAWIVGFALGGQHVVYSSWQPGDKRWHYALQVGAGGVALPALIQGRRMNEYTDPVSGRTRGDYRPLWSGFMAPPHRPVSEAQADEVAAWYAIKGAGYEMGTWYTVIAGMLNILIIYDAYGGPLSTSFSGRKREDDSPPADSNEKAADEEAADEKVADESLKKMEDDSSTSIDSTTSTGASV